MLRVIMLSVVLLSVILLSVVMLSVVAPSNLLDNGQKSFTSASLNYRKDKLLFWWNNFKISFFKKTFILQLKLQVTA
jgi:hypothetical protein